MYNLKNSLLILLKWSITSWFWLCVVHISDWDTEKNIFLCLCLILHFKRKIQINRHGFFFYSSHLFNIYLDIFKDIQLGTKLINLQ